MKIQRRIVFGLAMSALLNIACAATRSSVDYSVTTDTIAMGGGQSNSANYAANITIGGVVGASSVGSQSFSGGLVGQINEVATFSVAALSPTVNEAGAQQFTASGSLEDGTTLSFSGGDVIWSVLSGPVLAISVTGLATADVVYQDTPASIRGSYLGVDADANVTVLDINTDNFGSYANDQISDGWQVQYFGEESPNAGPAKDPDGDGQDNQFEFVAGLVPTDPTSHFVLKVEDAGVPKNLIFSPRLPSRIYTPQFCSSLSIGDWQSLTGTSESDNADERTVTDPNAANDAFKFYRVQITGP